MSELATSEPEIDAKILEHLARGPGTLKAIRLELRRVGLDDDSYVVDRAMKRLKKADKVQYLQKDKGGPGWSLVNPPAPDTRKRWNVEFPIAGSVYIEGIRADTAEEAKDKAREFMFNIEPMDDSMQEPELRGLVADVGEWGMFDHITQGNMCSAPLNSVCVDEMTDDD